MSKAAHTPEPWQMHGMSIVDGEGNGIANAGEGSITIELANKRRAVACVNACAGMADPAAEIAALRDALCRLWDWCERNGSPGAIAQSIRKDDIGPKVKKAFGGSMPTP
jgi:hypothetical protein